MRIELLISSAMPCFLYTPRSLDYWLMEMMIDDLRSNEKKMENSAKQARTDRRGRSRAVKRNVGIFFAVPFAGASGKARTLFVGVRRRAAEATTK